MTPRRAFLLAAGLGTRLGPLTAATPKCLLPLGGEPLLHWWLKILEELQVEEALLNTHHLARAVEAFVAARRYGVRVKLFHEPELLGSGGTIAANRSFVEGESAFWIFYADTLIADDLSKLSTLHVQRRSDFTLGLFRPPDPRNAGIVELNSCGRILSFEEKPARPKSPLASAGAYLAGRSLLKRLPLDGKGLDLGKDVVPGLLDTAYGLELSGVIDIGMPENYDRANREWRSLGFEARFE